MEKFGSLGQNCAAYDRFFVQKKYTWKKLADYQNEKKELSTSLLSQKQGWCARIFEKHGEKFGNLGQKKEHKYLAGFRSANPPLTDTILPLAATKLKI